MKQIKNWRKSTVADVEADNLLEDATLIHVVGCTLSNGSSTTIKGDDIDRIKEFLQYHINNEIPIAGHNFIGYDIPLFEKILDIDLRDLMVIDTLYLSYYLNVNRKLHGLDSFFEDYGIAKPKIDDWEGLTFEEYKNRVQEDVKINLALWKDLVDRLTDMYSKAKEAIDAGLADGTRVSGDEVCYIDQFKGVSSVDDHIERFLTFLMFKADCARLQEKTEFRVDVEAYQKLDKHLDEKILEAKVELEGVMPKVPKYSKKKKPSKPFLKAGGLSASGISWNEALEGLDEKDELGNPLSLVVEGENNCVKVLKKYEEPKITSPKQIKDWLFSHGWQPQTFEYVEDKEAKEAWVRSGFKKDLKPTPRKVPQLSVETDEGKDLCPSVKELADKVPEIMAYSKFTLIKHRSDVVKGYLKNLSPRGTLKARVGGLANTLRVKHRELVNLVGVDKPYGEELRGGLTCKDDELLLGSDLSSLEDRVKHHFMIPHDPEYVMTMMADDYDPHILMALTAGFIDQKEFSYFKLGKVTSAVKAARSVGKTINYASTYNAGAATVARSGDIPLTQAKKGLEAYWELNWSVKAIAEEQCVIKCNKGLKWLVNPVNGFLYNIRKDSDRFSTLAQGTGSFFFDMWVDNVLTAWENHYGDKNLLGSFHDEFIAKLKDTEEDKAITEKITLDAISKVNKDFMLRRDLGCDVQFGKRYSEIH